MCKTKVKQYFDSLQTEENWFRFGTTFRTRNKNYYFDTGTGKIFDIDENVYKILNCILRTNNFENLDKLCLSEDDLEVALEKIKEAVETEHILQATPVTLKNIIGPTKDNLLHEYKAINAVTLEVTERCNLRCDYCIYGNDHEDYRNFGANDMSSEIAKQAVDFLFSHASGDKIYLAFYGGEPLLRFDLIKEITKYALDNKPQNINLVFSMTSNMTLMTEEMAEFIGSINDFSILASVDGPEYIHNAHRKFSDGKGSFAATMRGVKLLVDARTRNGIELPIMFSAVLTPPYSHEKFESIQSFISEISWLPAGSLVQTGYVSYSTQKQEYIPINQRPENQLDYEFDINYGLDPLEKWAVLDSGKSYTKTFSSTYLSKPYKMLHGRKISEKPFECYGMNGCCIPGARKAYVLTTGEIIPCERVGTIASIGNVTNGYNLEQIHQKYIIEYMNEAVKYCGECWAIAICPSCYSDCMSTEGTVDFTYRHKSCQQTRMRLQYDLACYHEISEHSPELIKTLNDYQLV